MSEYDPKVKKAVDKLGNEGPAKIGKFVVKSMEKMGEAGDKAKHAPKVAGEAIKKAPGKFTKAARSKLGL